MQNSNNSMAQLMTCLLARDLEDRDRVAYGLLAEIGLGAALLAQKLHAPDLTIRHGLHVDKNITISPPAWSDEQEHDGWQKVDYFEDHGSMLTWANPGGSQAFSSVFFMGGMQIDRFGATNLIGIRANSKSSTQNSNLKSQISNLAVRGPGSVGTPSAAFFASKYYFFSFEHSKRVFVPKVDLVSVPGTDRMRALGFADKKPRFCLTPLGVFDWDNEDGLMQVRSLHPGVSWEQVEANTGFEIIRTHDTPVSQMPTVEELTALSALDPKGAISRLDQKMVG